MTDARPVVQPEVEFGFAIDDWQGDPSAVFAQLREHCPVPHADEPAPHFTVSRHSDVMELLRNSDVWKSKYGPGLMMAGGGVLVSSDPPKHTAERLAITKVFRPSAIE